MGRYVWRAQSLFDDRVNLHRGTFVAVVPLNRCVRVIKWFRFTIQSPSTYKNRYDQVLQGHVYLPSHKPAISSMSFRASYIATSGCVIW